MPTETARVLLEVVAGLLPGTAMPEYTRQWGITEKQWHANDEAVGRVTGECDAYATKLRASGLNWVQTTWLYL